MRAHSAMRQPPAPVVVALLLVVLAVIDPRAAGATVSTVPSSTSTSSTSSTEFVSGGIGECRFDLLVPEGGAFESLSLEVHGPLQNTDCELFPGPPMEGAALEGNAFHGLTVSALPSSLPSGTVLLRCDSDEFIEGRQTVTIDFLEIVVKSVSATALGGGPAAAPRFCAASISCEYTGGGDLDWSGVPECGDADYDTRIEADDALRALRTAIGQPSCMPVDTVCDANGDGRVSAADALGILRVSVKLSGALDCPTPCQPGEGA